MKENNGRGRRLRLVQKVTLLLSTCALGLIVVLLLVYVVATPGHPRSLRQRRGGAIDSHQPTLEEIVSGSYTLYDLHIDTDELSSASSSERKTNKNSEDQASSYEGIYGRFCKLNWRAHQKDPSKTPMFRDLIEASDCASNHNSRLIPIRKVVEAAKTAETRALDLTAVVFHESRCGSTLVANLLATFSNHRVYSESGPALMALRACGEEEDDGSLPYCTTETATQIIRDVFYLMGLTDEAIENGRLFFKIQSVGSRYIQRFLRAFPDTPWLFVYREPVHVLQSQLSKGAQHANCVHQQHHGAPAIVSQISYERDGRAPEDLEPEEYCAAHLASITETAVKFLHHPHIIPVNYGDLPDRLYNILPQRLSVPISPTQKQFMKDTAAQYSKGRGNKHGGFTEDSAKKEAMANQITKNAAEKFLRDSYLALEAVAALQREQEY